MFQRRNTPVLFLLVVLCAAPALLRANVILDSTAPGSVTLFNLGGPVSIVDGQQFYEGLAVSGNNLLLSVGNAATATQTVWALPLVRSGNHIVGFGSPSTFASPLGYPGTCDHCFGNVMAGGLVVSGGGLLYTTMANSFFGQYTGGTSTMVDLASTGALTGGLNYVPSSFNQNGADKLKMSSTDANGTWYTLTLTGSLGSYSVAADPFAVGVPAFSFDYIPVDATFTNPGVILGDAFRQRLDYYQLDANGNPCNPDLLPGSCGPVIHLVTGDAQIGLGVVRDPVSGDFLFTTSNNDIYLLSDTIPEPSTISLAICGAALIAVLRRRGLKGRPTVN